MIGWGSFLLGMLAGVAVMLAMAELAGRWMLHRDRTVFVSPQRKELLP